MKLALFIFSTSIFTFSYSQVPSAGLIGSWTFTGNANDDSPNNNNGIVSGATLTTDRYGIANSAYNFDGINDQIVIPADPALYRYNTSFTISAWIRQTAFPTGFTQSIFTNRTYVSGSEFYIDGPGNGYAGYLGFASYNGSSYSICRSLAPVDINNGYQHVVMVYTFNGSNNNSVKMYINGVFNNMVTGMNNIVLSVEDTYIGWSPYFTQTDRHFNGDIDDIFLYDRALSETEILALNNPTANVASINKITNIVIYPNPANEVLNFEGDNEQLKYIRIQTLDGKIVVSSEYTHQLNISQLNAGLYIVSFLDENKALLSNSKFRKL
ncbi:MAG: LamG-like jellyroll fold domain-containing protein [Crocinitomicaceae bacterium]